MASSPDCAAVEAFLLHEADLLDAGRFDDWLALFTDDAVYWLPIARGQELGWDHLSHVYDDRRLLETRVRRAQHAEFHAGSPAARTVHLVTAVRFAPDVPEDAVAVLSNQMVVAYRQGATRQYTGVCRHELVPGGPAGFRIRLKRVDLVDSEGVHEGISVIL